MTSYYCVTCGFPLHLQITEHDAAYYIRYVCDDCVATTTEVDLNPELPPEQLVEGV